MSAHPLEPQVVRELRDHTDRGVIDGWAYCKCGWFVREHVADAHRRHLAERLAAAGLLGSRAGVEPMTACICRPGDPEGWYREDCPTHGREAEEQRATDYD